MAWVLIVGMAWVAIAAVAGLAIGRAIHVADERERCSEAGDLVIIEGDPHVPSRSAADVALASDVVVLRPRAEERQGRRALGRRTRRPRPGGSVRADAPHPQLRGPLTTPPIG